MCENQDFVHLHLHTEYSLLDGFARINKVIDYAKKLGMKSLGITDHGTMFGVIDFYRSCKANDIQPIIGVEAYLAPRTRFDKDAQFDTKPFHMLLLAQNHVGYQNLLKLSSEAQLNGYYYRPRIDRELLAAHSEGVIATSGCLAAEIPRMLESGNEEKARELIGWYQDVFGPENFYLELQAHDIPELERLNNWLIDNSKYAKVPLLATNDVHYVRSEDYDPHDTLLCIQTSSLKNETNRLKMTDNSYYLRSQAEMWNLFGDYPDALNNSLLIAERCEDLELSKQEYHLPVFPVPSQFENAGDYLRYLCEQGLEWRFGNYAYSDPKFQERLDHELRIINRMGFDTYFLIVWDLCQFARRADIWWNVRGSGAGSLVAYTLGITSLDPLENNLLFERFLNPGRVSMPDFDLDFPEDRRMEMIEYCSRKYGEDKVAAIITFGTLGAKAAIRDVGRALDIPLPEVDQIARTIPTVPKLPPIPELIGDNPEKVIPDLKQIYENNATARKIIDTAAAIEGVPRHASTHAAGIIVADRPLVEYIPLHRPTKGDAEDSPVRMVTQFPMETAESIGLLKIDFLGLSTLTILRKACDLIEQYHGIKYTMENIPIKPDPNDPEITKRVEEMFEMIGRGETIGVFQIESAGMRQMLTGMKPKTFEHIIAAISLYRPGPMEYIPTFNNRMHGKEAVHYHHPKLIPIVENTYGILVYQEQIMQVASELFGYELGEADLMRRAVSKKKEKDLLKHRQIFLERGPELGVDAEAAGKIFDDIEFFARYGFNKCVVGSTQIIDAQTGRLVQVNDLANGEVQVAETLSMNEADLRLQHGKVTAVMNNGVKPVYRLTTQLGRQIEATANHPFYAFDGWTLLGKLQTGDRIAVPRNIPVEGQREWADHQVIVLGHLLAEGYLGHPHGIYFYTGSKDQWEDYVHNLDQFDNTVASTHQRRGMYDVYSKRIDSQTPTEVVTWIEKLGLRNADSYTKFIPAEIFELSNRQIALLISRMWAGDGHINLQGRSLYYATSSEKMARQLQHLLLRLGIISRLRKVNFPYKDGRIGYQLFVTGNDNIQTFYQKIGIYFVSQEHHKKLEMMVLESLASMSSHDIVPLEIKHVVRQEKATAGMTWDAIARQTGVAITTFNRLASSTKSGFHRATIGQLANFFDSDKLRIHAENDIYWDRVVSIEYIGEQPTYDLTIEDTHNFVANDILVHNSHAADYAVITCQTAYLKCHYPHEYMSALMSVYFDDSARVSLFAADCRRMGIDVMQPNVNFSFADFSIEEHEDGKHIRFGMGAIKNVGSAAIEYLIKIRGNTPFSDLDDFLKRCDMREIGKRALESLIRVGAMDDFGDRAMMLANLEKMMTFSIEHHKNAAIGQVSMFDFLGDTTGSDAGSVVSMMTDTPPISWDQREQLRWEKALIGLYVSDHPLKAIWSQVQHAITHTTADLAEAAEHIKGRMVSVAGLIGDIRTIITKKGDPMAVVTLEDIQGTIEVVMFPQTWGTYRDVVEVDKVYIVRGEADIRGTDVQIKAKSIDTNFQITAADIDDYQRPLITNIPYEPDEEDIDEETGELLKTSPEAPPPPQEEAIAPATDGASVSHQRLEPQIVASSPYDEPPELREFYDRSSSYDAAEYTVSYSSDSDGYETYNPPVIPDEPEPPTPVTPSTPSNIIVFPGAKVDHVPSTAPYPTFANPPQPKPVAAPTAQVAEPIYTVIVHMERTLDTGQDRRRLQRIVGTVKAFPGEDYLCVLFFDSYGELKRMDFPAIRTYAHGDLVEELNKSRGILVVDVQEGTLDNVDIKAYLERHFQ